jgi:hypothetical protein
MTETLQEFLRKKNPFSPQREVKEFPRVIDLEHGLSVSIVQRLEIVGSTSTQTVRPGYMKSLFGVLSFESVPFIRNIADAIRFREMTGGFASKVLSTREPVRIITPSSTITGRCLTEDGIVYLEISLETDKEEHSWALRLDRYQCRVIFSILGRILGECEFPYP